MRLIINTTGRWVTNKLVSLAGRRINHAIAAAGDHEFLLPSSDIKHHAGLVRNPFCACWTRSAALDVAASIWADAANVIPTV